MLYPIVLSVLYAPLSLAFNLLVILTSPIWALIAAIFNLRKLPVPLMLVHTHDDDIYGSKTTKEAVPSTVFSRFKRATWWLCRNPGYGFDAYLLGYDSDRIIKIYRTTKGTFGGRKYAYTFDHIVMDHGSNRYSYKADIPLFAGRYLKFWIGWKHNGGRYMFVFDFNPFKKARK